MYIESGQIIYLLSLLKIQESMMLKFFQKQANFAEYSTATKIVTMIEEKLYNEIREATSMGPYNPQDVNDNASIQITNRRDFIELLGNLISNQLQDKYKHYQKLQPVEQEAFCKQLVITMLTHVRAACFDPSQIASFQSAKSGCVSRSKRMLDGRYDFNIVLPPEFLNEQYLQELLGGILSNYFKDPAEEKDGPGVKIQDGETPTYG